MNDPWIEIKQEIEKYSYKECLEFMKIFPCEKKNYFLPIYEKIYNPRNITIFKNHQVGMTSMSSTLFSKLFANKHKLQYNKQKYITCSNVKDFWYRWNEFKKIRLFL